MLLHPEFEGPWIKVPLAVATDTNLSYRALGLLVSLFAAGPDGPVNGNAVWGTGDREGRNAVYIAKKELRDRGHIWVSRGSGSGPKGSSTHVSWAPDSGEVATDLVPQNQHDLVPKNRPSDAGPYKEQPSVVLSTTERKYLEGLRPSATTSCRDLETNIVRPRSTTTSPKPRPQVDQGPDLVDVIGSNHRQGGRSQSDGPADAEFLMRSRFSSYALEQYFARRLAAVSPKAISITNQRALMRFFTKLHKEQSLEMHQIQSMIDLCSLEIPELPTIPPWRYFIFNAQSYLARITERQAVQYDDDSYWLENP